MRLLTTILELTHYDKDGNILWYIDKINNEFHTQGEQFILNTVFNTSGGIVVPSNYYIGLDDRTTVNQSDTLQSNITGEPSGNGYSRQAISSSTGFGPIFDGTNWSVQTATIFFSATGGSWGPVLNAFLATGAATTGYLISTLLLDPINHTPRTVGNGEVLTFKVNLSLGN